MPLLHLEHFLVLTDDLEQTKDFYCRALGMQAGPRPPLAFPGHWLYLGSTPCIHLAEWQTYRAHSEGIGIPVSTRASGTGPVDHLAFTATHAEGVRARLVAYGARFSENYVPGGRLMQFFVHDPNGVKVEVNVTAPEADI